MSTQVIRYQRPFETVFGYPSIVEESINSCFGITVVFYLNYETETVTARYSVCRGDTFNKKEGIRKALGNNQGLTFSTTLLGNRESLCDILYTSHPDSLYSREVFLYDKLASGYGRMPNMFRKYLDSKGCYDARV